LVFAVANGPHYVITDDDELASCRGTCRHLSQGNPRPYDIV